MQINFATHMAESIKPLHLSMSVFLCHQKCMIGQILNDIKSEPKALENGFLDVFCWNRSALLRCIILTMSVRKQTFFLTLTTAVIFLSIISNLSIMSSSVVCIFALLYVYITNNEYSNQGVTIKLYLNKTDTFLLESLSCMT